MPVPRRNHGEPPTDVQKPPETPRAISHDLVYFTARPRFTLEKTRRWLSRNGYPDAPVLTSLAITDAIAETRYKRREIRKLRSVFPNLLIGIGNTRIDSEGYGSNGMLSLMLDPEGDGDFGAHSIRFHDWGQIAGFFEVNREILSDPARVEAAIRGEEMLLVPALRYVGTEDP